MDAWTIPAIRAVTVLLWGTIVWQLRGNDNRLPVALVVLSATIGYFIGGLTYPGAVDRESAQRVASVETVVLLLSGCVGILVLRRERA